MDVFLVPVGRDAYELYCEHVDEPEAHGSAEEPRGGFLGAAVVLSQPDPDLPVPEAPVPSDAVGSGARAAARRCRPEGSWLQRAKRRVMRWVAESIAEQRLLWNLRRHDDRPLLHPDDIAEEARRRDAQAVDARFRASTASGWRSTRS